MTFDPITSWSSTAATAFPAAYGEHDHLEIARHVRDLSPRRAPAWWRRLSWHRSTAREARVESATIGRAPAVGAA